MTNAANARAPHPRSVQGFCERVGISRQTFYNLRKRNEAPDIVKIGSRTLILPDAEERWLQRMAARQQSAA